MHSYRMCRNAQQQVFSSISSYISTCVRSGHAHG